MAFKSAFSALLLSLLALVILLLILPPLAKAGQPDGDAQWVDVDCSGQSDAADSLAILRRLAGAAFDPPDGCFSVGDIVLIGGVARLWGDVNCDNSVGIKDVLYILLRTAGIDTEQSGSCPPPTTAPPTTAPPSVTAPPDNQGPAITSVLADPDRLAHPPCTSESTVSAIVDDASGIQQVILHWGYFEGLVLLFQEKPMAIELPINPLAPKYLATVDAGDLPSGSSSDILYYITARDNHGNEARSPLVFWNSIQVDTCPVVEYVTQEGDTWESIAFLYNIDPEELAAYNGYSVDDYLPPGTIILVWPG
ncbi:MAG TPA: LysM domain-containing protein [Dehalococcoidia bacterium]|nr:LysM domain-containing protein [Dehalococcoidia bacterium]